MLQQAQNEHEDDEEEIDAMQRRSHDKPIALEDAASKANRLKEEGKQPYLREPATGGTR